MNDFKRGGKGGFSRGGGSFGGRPPFKGGKKFGGGGFRGGNDRDNRYSQAAPELFSATCAQCGKHCEVPFRPSGEKPVFCRDCFRSQDHVPGRNSNGSDGPRRDFDRFERNDRPERDFRPQHTKTYSPDGLDSLKRQIIALESKVDRILQMVSRASATKAPSEEVVPAKKSYPVSEEPAVKKAPKKKQVASKSSSKKAKK